MGWLIRMLVLLFLVFGSACGDDAPEFCGGPEVEPELIGAWESDGRHIAFDPAQIPYEVCRDGTIWIDGRQYHYELADGALWFDGHWYTRSE